MRKITSALFLTLGFAFALGLTPSTAKAGGMIEPFLGYENADFKFGAVGSGDADSVTYGLRVGYRSLGFMLGGEYQSGSMSVDYDGGGSDDYDTTDLGLFAGYEFPILLRAWITYYVSSQAKDPGGVKFKGDGGTKLGVGYTGFPFIDINFARVTRNYDEIDGGATGLNYSFEGWMLSVSLPLP